MNNLKFMKEKLIDLIIDHYNQYNEPPKTTLDFYKFVRIIGKGAFSKVHLAINILTNKYVAIKCIEKTIMNDVMNKKKILNEIFLLKTLNH